MTISSVICDWLDVTSHPDSELPEQVISFASGFSTDILTSGDGDSSGATMRIPDGGTLRIDRRKNHSRISASGSALGYLRGRKLLNDYLDILGSGPHQVTRLDAAYDTSEDGAVVFSRLKRKYKRDRVMLTRKGLKSKFISEFRDSDGKESGTFYAGHRSDANVTARVYDKALEILQRTGATDGLPLTRYELTVRSKVLPTLRDAAEPDRIFWHFMSPALLKKPSGVESTPWVTGWGGGWESDPRESDPATKLRSLVDAAYVLDRMEILADELGPNGRRYLRNLLDRRFVDLP